MAIQFPTPTLVGETTTINNILYTWDGAKWTANNTVGLDARYVQGNAAQFVENAGDTMTGALTLPADPVNPLEAATKQYVDRELPTDVIAMAKIDAAGGGTYNCNTVSNILGQYYIGFVDKPANTNYIIQATADYRPNNKVVLPFIEGNLTTVDGFHIYLNDNATNLNQANALQVVVYRGGS